MGGSFMAQTTGERVEMETLLREAQTKHDEIPPDLKENIILEHAPLIRYIVNRIAADF